MEVDNENPRPADTMEVIPTHTKETERVDFFSTSPLIPAGSPLEEGQISTQHPSPLPPTTSCDKEVQAPPFYEPSSMEPDDVLKSSTQNNAWIDRSMDTLTVSVIDHGQEFQKLDKGKGLVVDGDWASGCSKDRWGTPTAVIVVNQDTAPMNPAENGKGKERSDNWDSGWSGNNPVNSMVPHATNSPPGIPSFAAPATMTNEETNTAWVNSVQETPQLNQSTTEKPVDKGWGSWGASHGCGSPIPASGAADEWGTTLPTSTGGNESGSGTSGWNLKATSRGKFEARSEGRFERGRGRERGRRRGRDRDWSGPGGSGRRDDFSSRDQPLAKSFNQSSTSFGNPDNRWGTRSGENNQTIETSPARTYQQERSTQSTWGSSLPPPPIHQAQPSMESQLYQSPLFPATFRPPTPPVTMQRVLWPLHTELTLKRDFSSRTSQIAKHQARLTELETRQRHVHSWYNSQANNLPQLHADDPEVLKRELSKAQLRRDDNLATLKVDEKKYAGLAEIEWMLLVRTLTEEMARTLESGVHELLWKMTTAAGDGKRGFDINHALEEIVKTAMPSIIERPLQRYAESIVKAAEKKSRKVEAAAAVEDYPMKEQSNTKQDSSSDLQEILARLSALEQENADLKASNIELQEAIRQLEVETQEKVSSVRKEALGWTLEGQDHPVARQIREKFQAERDFIIEGITSNLRLAFEAVLDRHSPDI